MAAVAGFDQDHVAAVLQIRLAEVQNVHDHVVSIHKNEQRNPVLIAQFVDGTIHEMLILHAHVTFRIYQFVNPLI